MSFGPRRRPRDPGAGGLGGRGGRGGLIAILGLAVLLAGLSAGLGLMVTHQNRTIHDLRAALQNARRPVPVTATELPLPTESGSAQYTVPVAGGGSLSVVAVALRTRPGLAALTWLYIDDQHAKPGASYGVLEGTCGGQFVTSSDLADGTADSEGDLAIVAPNLFINPRAANVWVLVYRLEDGITLGGVQGPLIGPGARAFRSTPPC